MLKAPSITQLRFFSGTLLVIRFLFTKISIKIKPLSLTNNDVQLNIHILQHPRGYNLRPTCRSRTQKKSIPSNYNNNKNDLENQAHIKKAEENELVVKSRGENETEI